MNEAIIPVEPMRAFRWRHGGGLLLAGVLPALAILWMWRASLPMVEGYPPGAQLRDYPVELAGLVFFNTLIFAFASALSALCFLQFKETGRIVKPILALPLFVGGLLELVRMLVIVGGLPANVPEDVFITVSRITTEVVMMFWLCLLPTVFIMFDTIKGKRRQDRATEWAIGLSVVMVAVSLWGLRALTHSSTVQEWVMAGPFSQHVFRWLPLGLAVFLGVFVLPTYVKLHPSLFVQSVWVACLPLGGAYLFFALHAETGWGWNATVASAIKLAAFLIPAFGLVWEYRWTHRAMREQNRTLNDHALYAAQREENARNQERYLTHVMNRINLPLCMFDRSLRAVKISEAVFRAAGVAAGTPATGLTPDAIFPASFAAVLIRAGKEAIKQPSSIAIQETWDGGIVKINWSVSALTDEQGHVLGVMAVGKEVA
ncbi:MAG TPA: hypothetical protein PKE26_11575 [Kiritimatiellia bacterium]|nr:hypothetical protein [Kiritimatiellia bacterium]HMO99740.1 hypothetical protein [Kiritimatiellia bacterium]HMP97533.1 hypothetical protein [Kiritimatiellia bacterium]